MNSNIADLGEILFPLQSTFVVALMTIGILLRAKRKVHVRLMLTAIVWDLILVLQIELSRGAIKQAVDFTNNMVPLNIHLFFAITTPILYIFMILSGRKLLKGSSSIRGKHILLGKITYFFRMATYITAFFIY